jgi:pimeloyl-ACP methyl ester carboxylesterase
MPQIDRQFVRLPEGLVHLRRVEGGGGMPLVLLHASPGSSRGLEPLLTALAARGNAPLVIAPDTPGHGDSAPLPQAQPEIADYAEALVRLLDAMGLERVALYGTHTGARVACEVGVLFPDRIGPLLFDGIGEYSPETQAEFLEHYAPEKQPDDYGTQMIWAFNFVRDQPLHFPYYKRDPEHRLTSRPVLGADALHDATVEVLKAIRTYHHAYRAAFRYPTRARLAELKVHASLLDVETELPTLRAQMRALVETVPSSAIVPAGATMDSKAEAILDVLDLPAG